MRDALAALANKPQRSPEKADAVTKLARWKTVLEDELANTKEALPLLQADVRLDPYYGGDHTCPHGTETIQAKLAILQQEITEYLPSLQAKLLDGAP